MYHKQAMYQKQKGATFWQILFVGGMVAVFVYVGVMLTPVYFENLSVKKVLTSLKDDGSGMSKGEIKRRIQAQFDVDQVTRVKNEDILIKRVKDGMRVSVDYDVKIPLVGNIFILAEYRESVVL